MIHNYEEALLEHIDSMVETATDDELFASGYLRGHISLAAADCEVEGINDLDVFRQRVVSSLKENANELSPTDQAIVGSLWENLQGKV
ncbi:YfcL family protein [Parasalinivibrio latis]|uniref:YfcL family protein n=1 Tax=Parasalinivibrio latis TaxID=2952610 RepID=UPI0030E1B941